MDARREPAFDELFTHRAWVRALAVRLVRDASAADDLEQDTWLQALRGGGRARSLRTWLGGIVRHRARRSHERETARRTREERTAREGSVPSPDELLARAEVETRLLAAVAELPEPYRVVVLLRHYDDLSPEEIAERLGEPGSTVRNRLARAHERLRAKLDRECAGAAAWTSLVLPFGGVHAGQGVAVGAGIAMKVKLAVGACVVAGFVGWAVHERTADGEHALASVTVAPVQSLASVETTSTPAIAPVAAAERVVAADAVIDSVLLSGRVLGAPLELLTDATMTLVDASGSATEATIGAGGHYSAFGLRPGRVRIVVRGDGLLQHDESIVLTGDRERHTHDVELTAALTLPVRFVSSTTKEPLAGGRHTLFRHLSVIATRTPVEQFESVRTWCAWHADAGRWSDESGGEPSAAGRSGTALEISAPLPVWAHLVLRDVVLETRLVDGSQSELVFEIDEAALRARFVPCVVRCVDARNGAPLANAKVDIGFQDSTGPSATTDAEGLASFDERPPGVQQVRVRLDGHASASAWAMAGVDAPFEIALWPCASIAGRVVADSGEPLKAKVEARTRASSTAPDDHESWAQATASHDGAFTLPCLDATAVRVVASCDGFAPAWTDFDASGNVEGLDLRLVRGTEVLFLAPSVAWMRVHLRDASGGVVVSLWVAPSAPKRQRLAPGRYEIEVVVAGSSMREELVVGGESLVKELRAP